MTGIKGRNKIVKYICYILKIVHCIHDTGGIVNRIQDTDRMVNSIQDTDKVVNSIQDMDKTGNAIQDTNKIVSSINMHALEIINGIQDTQILNSI